MPDTTRQALVELIGETLAEFIGEDLVATMFKGDAVLLNYDKETGRIRATPVGGEFFSRATEADGLLVTLTGTAGRAPGAYDDAAYRE